MTWLFVLGGIVLASATLVCSAALVEVFRQLADIRTALNLRDAPIPLDLKSGELGTGDVGLPEEIALEPAAMVVALSSKCATCLSIADTFRGGAPSSVWFLLPATPPPTALVELLAGSAERVILDENDEIADRIGLHVTPSVLTTSYGEITRAYGVSSARQVRALLPNVPPRHREPATSPQPRPVSQEVA